MTGLKDKVARTQQQSSPSTYWRYSQKCQALGTRGYYIAGYYRTSSPYGHYPQKQEMQLTFLTQRNRHRDLDKMKEKFFPK